MQLDFHYFITYVIAKQAGFNEEQCRLIAYASQYTDDNTDRHYKVNFRGKDFLIPFPEKIENKGRRFNPIITQAISLEAKEIETQRYVYAPFHFLPIGNIGKENKYELKGNKTPYCTIAASTNAKKLLKDAIASGNPYRIGIAMHTFADTFSHERFTAFEEDWNKVKVKGPSIKKIIFPIGHAQILHTPDVISNEWQDKRFPGTEFEEVNNRERALNAIKAIFVMLNTKRRRASVSSVFQEIVEAQNHDERILLIGIKYASCPKYDKEKWFNDALDVDVDPSEFPVIDDPMVPWVPKVPRFFNLKFKDNFEKSHWYKFQMAAKKQLAWCLQNIEII